MAVHIRDKQIIFHFFLLITLTCVSCAGLSKSDIIPKMISEMEHDCRKVEIKRDYGQDIYVMEYTGKMSRERSPIALVRTWREGKLIEEKEVSVCGCKDGKGR